MVRAYDPARVQSVFNCFFSMLLIFPRVNTLLRLLFRGPAAAPVRQAGAACFRHRGSEANQIGGSGWIRRRDGGGKVL
jgi:hypothetical protein